MEAIKTIGASICLTIVATSIFSMLMPNTKLDKILKFAISLFFLASLVSPFANASFDFHIDLDAIAPQQTTNQVKTAMDNSFSELAAMNLEAGISRMLKQNGIAVKKTQVIINKSELDNITISKLIVHVDENATADSMTPKIQELIKREVGKTVPLYIYRN